MLLGPIGRSIHQSVQPSACRSVCPFPFHQFYTLPSVSLSPCPLTQGLVALEANLFSPTYTRQGARGLSWQSKDDAAASLGAPDQAAADEPICEGAGASMCSS